VLGLSFKPETDDLRDAPSISIINELMSKGAHVRAYDPVARSNAKKILGGVDFGDTAYDTVSKTDAVLVTAEWGEFRELDLDRLKSLMKARSSLTEGIFTIQKE